MHKHNFVIEYKPGKDMIPTNCLSHFPSFKENLTIELHMLYNIL